jgi:hypothetical protein
MKCVQVVIRPYGLVTRHLKQALGLPQILQHSEKRVFLYDRPCCCCRASKLPRAAFSVGSRKRIYLLTDICKPTLVRKEAENVLK